MRLFKPMEHLQAALRAFQSSTSASEQITTISRQLAYCGYLTYDMLVWVRMPTQSTLGWEPIFLLPRLTPFVSPHSLPSALLRLTRLPFVFGLLAFFSASPMVSWRYILLPLGWNFCTYNCSVQANRLAAEARALRNPGEKSFGDDNVKRARLLAVAKSVSRPFSLIVPH